MTLEQVQIELTAIRSGLDDLYNEIDEMDKDDIKAAIDAFSDMVRDLEENLDGQ